MQATPKKLAVLISLLGISSPWSAGALANVVSMPLADRMPPAGAIRGALSLFEGAKPEAATIETASSSYGLLAKPSATRSTPLPRHSAKVHTQVLPAIVVTAKAMRLSPAPLVASISFTTLDELSRLLPSDASKNAIADTSAKSGEVASDAGTTNTSRANSEAGGETVESPGFADGLKLTQSGSAANSESGLDGRTGALTRARAWLAAQSTPDLNSNTVSQERQTVPATGDRGEEAAVLASSVVTSTTAASAALPGVGAGSDKFEIDGAASANSPPSAQLDGGGLANDKARLDALHSALLDLLWANEALLADSGGSAVKETSQLERSVALSTAVLDFWGDEGLPTQPVAASLENLDKDILDTLHYAHLDLLMVNESASRNKVGNLVGNQDLALEEPAARALFLSANDAPTKLDINEVPFSTPGISAQMKDLDRDISDTLHYAQLDLLKVQEALLLGSGDSGSDALADGSTVIAEVRSERAFDGHFAPIVAAVEGLDKALLETMHYAQLEILQAVADAELAATDEEPVSGSGSLPPTERFVSMPRPIVEIGSDPDTSALARAGSTDILASLSLRPIIEEIELKEPYRTRESAIAMYGEAFDPMAADENPLQGELVALNDMDEMRGGFETNDGLKISFGIERAVYINGSLVTTTSLNIADLSKLSAGQVQTEGLNTAGMALVQNGTGNSFATGQLSSNNVGTVIQNTLNNQSIQGVTLINATVNSLEMVKGSALQQTIRNSVIDSLRR